MCKYTDTYTHAQILLLLLCSCVQVEAAVLLFEYVQSHLCKLRPALPYTHSSARDTCTLSLANMHGYRHVYAPCKYVEEFGGRDE